MRWLSWLVSNESLIYEEINNNFTKVFICFKPWPYISAIKRRSVDCTSSCILNCCWVVVYITHLKRDIRLVDDLQGKVSTVSDVSKLYTHSSSDFNKRKFCKQGTFISYCDPFKGYCHGWRYIMELMIILILDSEDRNIQVKT